MKVEVRREPPSRAVLEVELQAEEVSRGVDRALARLNQRVEIPGFRRGKAPKTMLQRFVGKDAVYEEAVKLLVPDAYTQALHEAGVTPIARPQIQVDPVEEGKPLRFVATVDLAPEVRLGDYRAIRIQLEEAAVTDADVDAAVEDLRARYAHLVTVGERPAASGDYVLIRTVEVTGTQERFLPGKESLVEIGGGTYPADIETALAGAVAGERRTVALSAQSAATVEVVDVKRREPPAVTDEFAKTAVGVATVQAMRETVRGRMQDEAQTRVRQDYEQKVVDALLETSSIELPMSLIEHEVGHLVADLAESLQRRGVTLARYLEATEKTDAQLREELRPSAERRLRMQLVLDEVARTEELQPSQEEIDREVENVARRLQQDAARAREWLSQQGRYDALISTLRRQKALASFVAIARGDPLDSTQGHPERSRKGELV